MVVYFNPRAYVRHDVVRSAFGGPIEDFNPRAYVRHDGLLVRAGELHRISIHVPT